jgi:hypothetical protein
MSFNETKVVECCYYKKSILVLLSYYEAEIMRHSKSIRHLFGAIFILFVLVPIACKNFWSSNKNSNTSNITVTIREPEKYQVTMYVSLDKGNDASSELPFVSVKATKDNLSRRYDFKFDNRELTYLEGVIEADKSVSKKPEPFHFLVVPQCKQYAEVRLDEMGIRIPNSLSPQDILATLQQQKTVEVLGDEQLNGRAVTKYRYVDPQAGEGIVYLDKQTGLPIRAKVAAIIADPTKDVGDTESEKRTLRVIIDIKDIVLNADSSQFQEPQGMKRVNPKEFCPELKQMATDVTQMLWGASSKK